MFMATHLVLRRPPNSASPHLNEGPTAVRISGPESQSMVDVHLDKGIVSSLVGPFRERPIVPSPHVAATDLSFVCTTIEIQVHIACAYVHWGNHSPQETPTHNVNTTHHHQAPPLGPHPPLPAMPAEESEMRP